MLIDFGVLPRSGVYSIIHEEARSAYVGYSSELLKVLPGLYEELGRKGVAGQALGFQVLSVGTDSDSLRLHTEYWRDWFREQGYSELLPRGRKTLHYEVRRLVNGDYTGVDVCLVTARGVRRIVGKFKTVPEAQEFIETCYGADNPYRLPVYGLNSLTKEFLLEHGINRIEI